MLIQVLVAVIVGLVMVIYREQSRRREEHGKMMSLHLHLNAVLKAVNGTEPFFACPVCAAVSYNRNDLKEGWCGRCHRCTRDPYHVALMDAEA